MRKSGGAIYTKNGKRLVMVPASTKKLVIRKGCTTVSMWAMSYSNDMEAEYEPVCKNLKSVTIPKNIRVIADEVFMDNKYLRKVILSKNLREIGKEAFCYCFNLKKIEWGKKLRRVGKSAFDFTGLKNVKLPASVKKKESMFSAKDCKK